jgi:hypothetical protein
VINVAGGREGMVHRVYVALLLVFGLIASADGLVVAEEGSREGRGLRTLTVAGGSNVPRLVCGLKVTFGRGTVYVYHAKNESRFYKGTTLRLQKNFLLSSRSTAQGYVVEYNPENCAVARGPAPKKVTGDKERFYAEPPGQPQKLIACSLPPGKTKLSVFVSYAKGFAQLTAGYGSTFFGADVQGKIPGSQLRQGFYDWTERCIKTDISV